MTNVVIHWLLDCGIVYSMDGTPLGYYDDKFRLYTIDGRYLGYGNFGWSGLLGTVLVLGLLGGGFGLATDTAWVVLSYGLGWGMVVK